MTAAGSGSGRAPRLWRDGEPFPQRFTATISADGTTIAGCREKAEDGVDDTADCTVTYRKLW